LWLSHATMQTDPRSKPAAIPHESEDDFFPSPSMMPKRSSHSVCNFFGCWSLKQRIEAVGEISTSLFLLKSPLSPASPHPSTKADRQGLSSLRHLSILPGSIAHPIHDLNVQILPIVKRLLPGICSGDTRKLIVFCSNRWATAAPHVQRSLLSTGLLQLNSRLILI
jgi:hypothetical protein